jgi:monoamine oxidase
MNRGGVWNPLLDAFSSYYDGAEFDQISTLDYAAYRDTGVNWRTPNGYGSLVAAWGGALAVRLATPVTSIDLTGARVRAVIVTVPTSLIAEGVLAFRPDLPHVRAAAAALPLGLANKLFLHLDIPESLPAETHLFGDPARTAAGSYHIRPFGRPMIEVFFGRALRQSSGGRRRRRGQ